ncbi:MAG: enoyl-CoA hydratase [Syntrophales bacterium]|nr:enoyl-CoA hydratase [Syntrophales bacterium]MDD5641023.1 enoyl-CoA hydratase [Syntrophales bacterium]
MSYDSLVFEVKDGVGLIRLNRPEEGNLITLEMASELLDAALRCDEDPQVRAVVLTGSGKMFCAGGDLKTFAAQGDRVSFYLKKVTQVFHAAISRFNWMDAPVVGAINGTAAGGGFSLALTTDIAIAAESAKFTMAYTKIGLAPDGSSSYFLARLVGLRRAKEMALLNPVLSAKQALEWGLINQVVADDQVLPAALDLAHRLAKGPTLAFGETKRLILAGATESLESQMEKESRAVAAMAGKVDGREGVAAFIGKRLPKFTGQ